MPTPYMPSDIAVLGTYRGYDIGWSHSIPPNLHPCWRIPREGKWHIGSVLAGDVAEAERIARDCVDYAYRVDVWELENGRKYDAFKDGYLPSNDTEHR